MIARVGLRRWRRQQREQRSALSVAVLRRLGLRRADRGLADAELPQPRDDLLHRGGGPLRRVRRVYAVVTAATVLA